ncbi:xylulokinase [Corynebacterium sp. YIM 101645]|uniref:Xylulose kinase n=1 Tax=Corynebacterium lemuris TaxID=1859292 RepID=A0ABT2FXE9_9CORY|nr:xylulokinase [Corynebacterium lemuris]MCS5479927.1 xylulokinase [Corynebacterium lemuris]
MTLVLGIDSSTQSCKAILVDAATGEVIDQQRASHPTGTEVDPAAWLTAMDTATAGLIERADAVSVAGQQHGMVALDEHGEVVRPALLWNDTRSAAAAEQLIEELGGPAACVELTGSLHVASITATKLRWLRDHEPENAARTASVMLPHDYLTWHLGGRRRKATDHGDASGTGYYSTRERRWLPELAEQALGHAVELPDLAGPNEQVGTLAGNPGGAIIAPGTGDNMAAALGLGLQPGDVSVSIGTSGVASAVASDSVHDPAGLVTGFADATGAYLPLACTLNGARVLELGRRLLGVEWDEFDALALAGEPGAGGLVLQPYLDGERTPNRPNSTGVLVGLTSTTTREDFARATVEGLLCSLRDAVGAVNNATGVEARRVLLIGGGAQSEAVRTIAPEIFGVDVVVPDPAEYVALGAARQAAWVLSGAEQPPQWPVPGTSAVTRERNQDVLDRYAKLREATAGW